MKRFFKIGWIFAVMLALTVAFAACGNDSTVDSVHIEKFDMPRVSYVQGQELDLSGGKLTVLTKDKSTQIALDAEGVTVSGYDKNKVGEQTLTVSYKNKTTEFTVTVLARVVAVEYNTDYFVGEDFASDKGHINVANDDGSITPLAFNAAGVTLEGFDSSKAGTVNVTASYNNYSGSFTVNIHSVDDMIFTAPDKKDYESHEEKLDLTGGYITVKAPNNAYSKTVALSDLPKTDIAGFDPLAVNEKNSPLTQNITVNYGNETFDFDLNIRYSDITYIRDTAAACKELNFDGENLPSIESDLGNHALESVNKYAALDGENRLKIRTEEMESIARVAAVYGKSAWIEETAKYSDVMTFSGNGSLMFLCKTKAATVQAYEKLADENEPIVAIGKTLMLVRNNFAALQIGEKTTVGLTLASVFDPVGFATVRAYMDFMFALDGEIVKCKNAQWSDDSLKTLLEFITANDDYLDSGKRSLYAITAETWNDTTDMFDKLYAYCFKTRDIDSVNKICDLYVPGKVGELYNAVVNVSYESYLLEETEEFETTWFAYYYTKAFELYTEAQSITSEENPMQAWLFEGIRYLETSLEDCIEYYNTTATYSYSKIFANVIGDESVSGLWNKYLEVMDAYMTYNNTEFEFWSNEAYGAEIDAIMSAYLNLSPAAQLKFLMSLYPYYSYGVPAYGFDITSDVASQFTAFIALRAQKTLTGNAFGVFVTSLLVNETYVRRYLNEDGNTVFIQGFETLQKSVEDLQGEDAESFATANGAYNLCKGYYEYANGEPSELGEWHAKFDQLADAIARVRFAYSAIAKGYEYISPLLSAYETAAKISRDILENAPEEIKREYYLRNFDIPVIGENTTANMKLSLDYGMYLVENIFSVMLMRIQYGSAPLYYSYSQMDISEFLTVADHLIWQRVYNVSVSFDNIPAVAFEKDKVVAAMQAMRGLTALQNRFYSAADSKYKFYYTGLTLYFESQLSAAAASAAEKLMQAEKSYFDYLVSLEADDADAQTAREKFLSDMSDAVTDYEALASEDKAAYDGLLAETYSYYQAKKAELENGQEVLGS